MGRGDIKTKKGKISKGSFGVLRPHKKAKPVIAAKAKAVPNAKKTVAPATKKNTE